jgi:4-hydroxybenzoate polyprenyltransferase
LKTNRTWFFFRTNIWWNHIIPTVLGVAFLLMLSAFSANFNYVFLFLVTLVSTATFGYFLNDLADIETDALAKKANSGARFSTFIIVSIVSVISIAAILPWIWLIKLPDGKLGFAIWLLE